MTITNMAIEAGGQERHLRRRTRKLSTSWTRVVPPMAPRRDYEPAELSSLTRRFVYDQAFDLSALEPTVAMHPNPGNRALAKTLGHIVLDRAYIGSCTGGKTSDFLAFAEIVKGQAGWRWTRLAYRPLPVWLTTCTRRRWDGKSVWEWLEEAGVQMTENASCAACLGGPVDTFGRMNKPLTCISATNRNFPGRMGHKESKSLPGQSVHGRRERVDRPDHRSARLPLIWRTDSTPYPSGSNCPEDRSGTGDAKH